MPGPPSMSSGASVAGSTSVFVKSETRVSLPPAPSIWSAPPRPISTSRYGEPIRTSAARVPTMLRASVTTIWSVPDGSAT